MKRDNSYLIGNQFAKGHKPNKTTFCKGKAPWNKNLKGIHLSPSTEWQKGQKGRNWLPIGSIKIRTDKGKKQRQWIKIEEPNKWILLAMFVWLKCNGTMPDGFLIHHLDGNTLNDDITNLACVTRATHINIHRKELKLNRAELAKDKYALFEGKQ